jgi:ligand-binding sensor domain-containing protein
MWEDKNGNLWFGTGDAGLSKYDGVYFTHYSENEGMSSKGIMRILEDKSNNLWFCYK